MHRRMLPGRTALVWAASAALLTPMMVAGSAADAQDIHVRVNGEPVYFENTRPMMMNGRVLVPLRGVLEHMGANVDWIAPSQTVVATRGDTQIDLPIGSHTATVNGRSVDLDTPAVTIGGSTMVPLRFVSEALGADVGWSDATQTVMIEAHGSSQPAAYREDRRWDQNVQRDQAPPRARPDTGGRQYYRASRRASIPAGTVIPVTLNTDLSSNGNSAGDRFDATVVSGPENAGLPDGTRVQGVVTEAIPSQNGKPGELTLEPQRLIFPDGTSQRIDAGVSSLDNKDVTHDSAGRLVARSNSSNRNDQLKWVGIGAGAGLLLSTVLHGNTLLDTLLGGGAGYLFNQTQRHRASNVRLGAGTEFGVRLRNDIAYDRGG